eukprot:COSAG05_NODE_32_length_28165_cov_450.666714_4_plen_69_part_00
MRWYGVDWQDSVGCPIALRNLLRANSSARKASDHWPPRALEFAYSCNLPVFMHQRLLRCTPVTHAFDA